MGSLLLKFIASGLALHFIEANFNEFTFNTLQKKSRFCKKDTFE